MKLYQQGHEKKIEGLQLADNGQMFSLKCPCDSVRCKNSFNMPPFYSVAHFAVSSSLCSTGSFNVGELGSMDKKVVLITGCSSGIGLSLAVRLASDPDKTFKGNPSCVCVNLLFENIHYIKDWLLRTSKTTKMMYTVQFYVTYTNNLADESSMYIVN